jgi:hypothetical protein
MIMMPYGWTLDIAAAHRPGRLLAPHTISETAIAIAHSRRFGSVRGGRWTLP